MTAEEAYKRWFSQARAGEIHVYHVGIHLFGIDAQKRSVAKLAWRDSQEGRVALFQRRVGGEFEYIAMKIPARLQARMKSWQS